MIEGIDYWIENGVPMKKKIRRRPTPKTAKRGKVIDRWLFTRVNWRARLTVESYESRDTARMMRRNAILVGLDRCGPITRITLPAPITVPAGKGEG